jgi:Leucine-rich repeat (LRR) protein
LKYLNVSANTLETIPPSSQSEESLSTLQELYLTGNNLSESVGGLLVGHPRLRVLHLAYNQLLSFPARCSKDAFISKRVSFLMSWFTNDDRPPALNRREAD